MFLLDFMRYFRGYVRFTAHGDFVERFLNLLARDHISVWDGRKQGNSYSGCVAAGRYAGLRRHAKKTGVHVRITEKNGVPFTRRKYRYRYGILAGLALFAVFLGFMSLFIWRVEVHGNVSVPESKIAQVLETLGIEPGVRRSGIDVRDSERRALLLLRELSWVALNIEGSVVRVEVSERIPPPQVVDPAKPCNIVAGASGQLLSLDAYEGQSLVAVGDTVMEGDVIVSGITQDHRGQSLFRHASAKAVARISHRIEVVIPLAHTDYVETGRLRNRNYLNIIGFDLPLFLPLSIPHPYYVERQNLPLTVFSLETPVSLFKERYILMEEVPVILTAEEAKQMALSELSAAEGVQLKNAEIENRALTAVNKDGLYTLRADYVCTMDIAVEREIFTEENPHQN